MNDQGRLFNLTNSFTVGVGSTMGFMLLGLDQQTSTKSKASLQFGHDQHL